MAELTKDLTAEKMESLSDLRGNEYFYCDRFRCRLLKTRCLERQGQAPWRRDLVSSFRECQDCQQGKEVRLELTGSDKPFRPRQPCLVSGCDDLVRSRGLCRKHYDAWVRGELEGFEPFWRGRGPARKVEPQMKPAGMGVTPEPHTAHKGSMQKPVSDQLDQAIQETNDLRRDLSQAREKVGYLRGLLEAEQERLSDLI